MPEVHLHGQVCFVFCGLFVSVCKRKRVEYKTSKLRDSRLVLTSQQSQIVSMLRSASPFSTSLHQRQIAKTNVVPLRAPFVVEEFRLLGI